MGSKQNRNSVILLSSYKKHYWHYLLIDIFIYGSSDQTQIRVITYNTRCRTSVAVNLREDINLLYRKTALLDETPLFERKMIESLSWKNSPLLTISATLADLFIRKSSKQEPWGQKQMSYFR